jgi:hypothetical protein
MRKANLADADLSNANLKGADLSEADLTGTYGVVSAGNNVYFINGNVIYVHIEDWCRTLEEAVTYASDKDFEPCITEFIEALGLYNTKKETGKFNFDRWESRPA